MAENKAKLMKDRLGPEAAQKIADTLSLAWPAFPKDEFIQEAEAQLYSMEMKQRVRHIIHVLGEVLPEAFSEAAKVLYDFKANWIQGGHRDEVFAAWPVIDYVAEYGLDHPKIALPLLAHLTSLFSAEFAIRPFLIHHYEMTYSFLMTCCDSEDLHVRRLASEGSRPRLPWGVRLNRFIEDPQDLLPILNKLKDDKEDYVYRSVANSLNDIAKDHPDWVIQQCRLWMKQPDYGKTQAWTVKHALRSLIKSGHPDVFSLLGFTHQPKIKLESFAIHNENNRLRLGETLEFSFTVSSESAEPQSMVVDYVIYHLKANGAYSPKVFKLKELRLEGLGNLPIVKRHPIKAITTRRYYAGLQRVGVLVNGVERGVCEFELDVE